jgi:hypothetical protein
MNEAAMQYEMRGRAAGGGDRGCGSRQAAQEQRERGEACAARPMTNPSSAAKGWNRMNTASTRYGWGGRRQPAGITGHCDPPGRKGTKGEALGSGTSRRGG